MKKRNSERYTHYNNSSNSHSEYDDDYYWESAKQYIIDHGKKPPIPSHLQGRAIGMWHAKISRLRKSLLPEIVKTDQRKKKFQSSLGVVSLSKSQKSEIKAILKDLPDKMDQSSGSYGHIGESEFKKQFLQNINGKLGDHMKNIKEEQQDVALDQILFNELKEKHKNPMYLQMLERRSTLPSTTMKSKIIELVELHQVILISGETGCGKTTQVPQFLLDSFIENKKASLCKIVCTQPRRISAISVAERVAQERAETLGLSAGYQIRLERVKEIIKYTQMEASSNDFGGNDNKFFTYGEVQSYLKELLELMSYEELNNINANSHEKELNIFNDETVIFNDLCKEKKVTVIRMLMDQLETVSHSLRMRTARSVLFIVLGCMGSPILLEKAKRSASENTILLLRLGMFPLLINMLNMERMSTKYCQNFTTHSKNSDICVILNILSVIVEQMLIQKRSKSNIDVELFIEENLASEEKDSLLFILLDMMTEFASSEKPGYPIKKILLLTWKIIMISFGGLEDLFFEKQAKRITCALNNKHSNGLDIYAGKYELPLLQKVSKKDLNNYIYKISLKYQEIGDTIAAESIKSLQKHLYIPLSELQVEGKDYLHTDKIEIFYENMLSKMKIYIESLLLIFQNSIRIPVVNMFGDCNEEIMSISSCSPLLILGKFHIFENLEIINKAISGIFLLLLKHFKLNHIYQFEYFSQVIVSCDAIPLMKTYLERTSELFIILTKSQNQRNLFTCVNVLRIVNKLIKGKYSRTKMFMKVNVKHLNSLTSLNNKHLEVYSLKLLKILSRLLGKKWRQDNMKIMNKIFQTLRHRLLEDCSAGSQNNNDDEEMLGKKIEIFNAQYTEIKTDKCFEENSEPPVELSDFFKKNYGKWLEEEVFQNPFDWDILLKT